ncbi:MAG TPA: M56 family metallopeptidase [Caulobacteraceae bacterium]|jgi:beta-lactamase regulating signal transducer with metallopeptidase domain
MTIGAGLLGLIADSALRSLLLGALVLAAVKLARLRDVAAEIAIWSAVLLAALAMPALTYWLPGLSVALPLTGRPAATAVVVTGGTAAAAAPFWFVSHAGALALGAYAAVAGFGLVRLLAGLLLMARLHARARPIADPWACGRDIRESAGVDAPLTYARAILLPQGWRDWPPAKLQAVLAHEDSHLRRGDFFILFLASAHRALFWFSPFAWWLKARLGELAEAAADRAAARRIADPAGYAEILLDVARSRRAPGLAVAMSGGPDLARRIDQVLDGRPERALGLAGRALALCAVLSLGLGLAEVRAAAQDIAAPSVHPLSSVPPARAPGRKPLPRAAADPPKVAARASRHSKTAVVVASTPGAAAPVAPPPEAEQVSYDPRALLEEPEAAVLPAVLLAGHRVNDAAD